jgi:GMP synthase (glutamine-hydrolysing)
VQYHPEFSLGDLAVIIDHSSDSLVAGGYFRDAAEAQTYCEDLRRLDAAPARTDIAWRLGIQPEVYEPDLRLTEIRNWIAHRVRPARAQRGRG